MLFPFNKNAVTDDLEIRINEIPITKVDQFKLLGIYIDSKLNFKFHIEQIITKINMNLAIIYKIKYFLNKNTLKILYYSMFYPHLYYCNLIWGHANKSTSNELYVTQKKVVKTLFSLNYFDTASNINIFNINKILSIFEINLFKSSLFIFNIVNNRIIISDDHIAITCCFSINNNFSSRSYDGHCFLLIIAKNKFSERNFCFYGPKGWNNLPFYIRTIKDYNIFKKHLKTFLNCYS